MVRVGLTGGIASGKSRSPRSWRRAVRSSSTLTCSRARWSSLALLRSPLSSSGSDARYSPMGSWIGRG